VTGAPVRDGASADGNAGCPPVDGNGKKLKPDPKYGDADISHHADQPDGSPEKTDENGNPTLDYFMGEWTFVVGNKNLKIQEWCINRRTDTIFHDYFTLVIKTSINGVDTTQVQPTKPQDDPNSGRPAHF
jgi:hypothetical protein